MSKLDDIQKIYGHSIYDDRAGRSWDTGQAVCAEQFGPNWMNDSRFIALNNLSDDIPVNDGAWAALQRLLDKKSLWAKPLDEEAQKEGGE